MAAFVFAGEEEWRKWFLRINKKPRTMGLPWFGAENL